MDDFSKDLESNIGNFNTAILKNMDTTLADPYEELFESDENSDEEFE